MKPKVRYVIVCEDVRQENNGKEILIGVYGDSIRLSRTPTTMRSLAFKIIIDGIGRDKIPFNFVFETPSKSKLIEFKEELAVEDPSRPGRLTLGFEGVQLYETGEYRIKIGFGGDPPRTCEKINVDLQESPIQRETKRRAKAVG